MSDQITKIKEHIDNMKEVVSKKPIPDVNPLLCLRNIQGFDFVLDIAYVPEKINKVNPFESEFYLLNQVTQASKNFYRLIDKQKDVPKILEILSKMGELHIWDVYMMESLANWIEEQYHPIGLYILAKFDDGLTQSYKETQNMSKARSLWPESVISIIRGEMIPDWDLRLEALKLLEM